MSTRMMIQEEPQQPKCHYGNPGHGNMATQKMISKLLLVITILWNCNMVFANAPNIDYSHNMRILKLPRSTPVGSIIYRLKGSDGDPDPLQYGVKDSVGQRLLRIQSINFYEADVILKSPLEEDEYRITIYVTDGREMTEIESKIIVTDPDVGAVLSPFSGHDNHIITLPESTLRNSTIGSVVAKERENSNLRVRFELRGGDDVFALKYVFGPKNWSRVDIILNDFLDYERKNLYLLHILALNPWTDSEYDTRNIAEIRMVVVVEDVQDTPPRFIDLPSIAKIYENMKPGDLLVQVKAEDGDYGNPRNITYKIDNTDHRSDTYRNYFSLNSKDGRLTLKAPAASFKRENSPYILRIIATEVFSAGDRYTDMEILGTQQDKVSAAAELAIVVVATENHPPQFASSKLVGFIEENSPSLTAVRWKPMSIPQVIDSDPGPDNNTFSLSLIDQQAEMMTPTFMVQPAKGVGDVTFTILLNVPRLDYEKKREYVLTLQARDHSIRPLISSVKVYIHVVDVNDIVPQFSLRTYHATIREDAPIGTTVAHVKAFDKDTGEYGAIRYTSINGPIANNLKLDPETGLITLQSRELIDREQVSSYQLTVEARDELGMGNRNVCEIILKIQDANDNAPKFLQPRYDAILNPDRMSFMQPLIVKAVDLDEPHTDNSNVTYEIIAGNYQDKFQIDPVSGEITLKAPLRPEKISDISLAFNPYGDVNDRFLPMIALTVRAHDQGIPYQSDTVDVHIHNQDYLNRSVSFFMNDADYNLVSRKDELERSLTLLTGARVNIYSISPLRPGEEDASVANAWVTYPLHSTVDLRTMPVLASEIMGKDKHTASSKIKEIQGAQIITYSHEYEPVFWVLLALVVATILFLFILLIIYCLCLRKPNKSEVTDSRTHDMRTRATLIKTHDVEAQIKTDGTGISRDGSGTKKIPWKETNGSARYSKSSPSTAKRSKKDRLRERRPSSAPSTDTISPEKKYKPAEVRSTSSMSYVDSCYQPENYCPHGHSHRKKHHSCGHHRPHCGHKVGRVRFLHHYRRRKISPEYFEPLRAQIVEDSNDEDDEGPDSQEEEQIILKKVGHNHSGYQAVAHGHGRGSYIIMKKGNVGRRSRARQPPETDFSEDYIMDARGRRLEPHEHHTHQAARLKSLRSIPNLPMSDSFQGFSGDQTPPEPKRTEILYIRSPVAEVQTDPDENVFNFRALSQTDNTQVPIDDDNDDSLRNDESNNNLKIDDEEASPSSPRFTAIPRRHSEAESQRRDSDYIVTSAVSASDPTFNRRQVTFSEAGSLLNRSSEIDANTIRQMLIEEVEEQQAHERSRQASENRVESMENGEEDHESQKVDGSRATSSKSSSGKQRASIPGLVETEATPMPSLVNLRCEENLVDTTSLLKGASVRETVERANRMRSISIPDVEEPEIKSSSLTQKPSIASSIDQSEASKTSQISQPPQPTQRSQGGMYRKLHSELLNRFNPGAGDGAGPSEIKMFPPPKKLDKLKIKHSDLLDKKSIFTITYDGVKSRPLQSAGGSPPEGMITSPPGNSDQESKSPPVNGHI